MPWIEKEGRTVEEAREAAIAQARRPEADLEIEVIREGAKGLFGLGGEPAVVRVRPKDEARDVRSAFQDDLDAGPESPAGEADTETPASPRAPAEPEATSPPEPSAEEAPPRESREDREEDEVDEESGLSVAERQEAAMEVGREMVEGVLKRVGLEGEVQTKVSGDTVFVEVFGEEMGILIGRGGATLEALQEIVRAGVRRRVKTHQPVVVDCEGYWQRRKGRGGKGRN